MPMLLQRAAAAVGVLLYALLLLVLLIQIGARFLLGLPLPWTDEAAVILYLWAVLWTAALVCREREHVVFDLLLQGRGAPTRRIMALLGALTVGGLCAWALPQNLDYILFMGRESSAVLGLPLHLVYAPFALLLAALALRSLARVRALLSRRWRAALDETA